MGEWSTVIKTISTALGALMGYMFGGWSLLIHILLVFVIIDWLTGWAAAWINGELRSRVGYYGIARKIAIFLLVMVSHFADLALGGLPFFQNTVIFFYLANELLSIIENVGRMGVPIPQVFRGAIEEFNKRSGEEVKAKDETSGPEGQAPDSQDKAI